MVVWDDAVEALFQTLASERSLFMLTTTIQRFLRYGAVGNDRCWSMFGQPVTLGSWSTY